jgi:hypothetical protein
MAKTKKDAKKKKNRRNLSKNVKRIEKVTNFLSKIKKPL